MGYCKILDTLENRQFLKRLSIELQYNPKIPLLNIYTRKVGNFLVAQWLRIHQPIKGTQVQSLVREDPTCRGATKPVCQLLSLRSRAHKPKLLKPERLEPVLHNKRSHLDEKPRLHTTMKSSHPLAVTRESSPTATKTQCSQKKKKIC